MSQQICELGKATSEFGNKAWCFTKLKQLSIPYPPGIVLSADLINVFEKNTEERHLILESISNSVKEYNKLAIRSSGLSEDGNKFSYAGIFDSVLGITNDLSQICDALLKVISSGRSEYIENYANPIEKNIERSMAVIIQKMILPAYSGVVFSHAYNTNGDIICYIELVHGVGNLSMRKKEEIETVLIKYKNCNTLEDKVQYKGCLRDLSGLNELLKIVKKLISAYSHPIDIEWCIDEEGKPYILQVRPITELVTVDDEVCINGFVSSNGVGKGKAYVINDNLDMTQLKNQIINFPSNSILVSSYLDTQYYPALMRAAGIITDDGSLISHPSIISRERRIPCLISAGNLCSKIVQNDDIEINTYKKEIKINGYKYCIGRIGIDWADVYYFDNIYETTLFNKNVLVEPSYEGAVIYTSPQMCDSDNRIIEAKVRKVFGKHVRIYNKDKYYWYFENKRFYKFFFYGKLYKKGISIIDDAEIKSIKSYYNKCVDICCLMVQLKKKLEDIELIFIIDEMMLSIYFILDMLLPMGYAFVKSFQHLLPALIRENIELVDLLDSDSKDIKLVDSELRWLLFFTELSNLRNKVANSMEKVGAYRFDYFDDREDRVIKVSKKYSEIDSLDCVYGMVNDLEKQLYQFNEFYQIKEILKQVEEID